VLGPDVESDLAKAARNAVRSRMRVVDESAIGSWSWEKELTACFGNQSPGIKGSFKSPPPGRPATEPPPKGLQVGLKIDDLNDRIARSNFRVVVIRPMLVEATDLNDPENARRQLYTYEEDGTWSHQTLWP